MNNKTAKLIAHPVGKQTGAAATKTNTRNGSVGEDVEDESLRSNANNFLREVGEVCRSLRLHHARQLLTLESDEYEILPCPFEPEWDAAAYAWSKLCRQMRKAIPAEDRLLSAVEARLTILRLKLTETGDAS